MLRRIGLGSPRRGIDPRDREVWIRLERSIGNLPCGQDSLQTFAVAGADGCAFRTARSAARVVTRLSNARLVRGKWGSRGGRTATSRVREIGSNPSCRRTGDRGCLVDGYTPYVGTALCAGIVALSDPWASRRLMPGPSPLASTALDGVRLASDGKVVGTRPGSQRSSGLAALPFRTSRAPPRHSRAS